MKRRLIALTVVILLAGAGWLTFHPFTRHRSYAVTAYFTKTIGLFPRSDVRVLGVAIGKVRSVEPMGDKVAVVMDIDSAHKVPANATAFIVPISLISDRYVQLSPPYSAGPSLVDGSTIPITRTSVPAELDDLLSSLQRFFSALESGRQGDPGALSSAVANLAASLAGSGQHLDETLGAAGSISGVLGERSTELDSAIVHLSRFIEALSSRGDEITELNTNLSGALGGIADEQAALDSSLKNLALLTEQVGSILDTHRLILSDDIHTLAKVSDALVRQQSSIIRANDWLPVLTDGGSDTHNGGAVHLYDAPCPVGMSCPSPNIVPHVDVREVHYGECPFAVFCAGGAGGGGGASASTNTPRQLSNARPAGSAVLASPDPLTLIQPIAGRTASHDPEIPPDSISERILGFFIRFGGIVDGAIGGRA